MRLRRLLLCVVLLLLTAPNAPHAQALQHDLSGVYTVSGINPAGKPYEGTAEIRAQGSVFILHWVLGQEEVYGVGFVSHGMLVVAAGPPTPAGVMLSNVAAYTLVPGEPLRGQWAMPGGTGIFTETLVKVSADHPAPAPQQQRAKPDTLRQRGV